MLVFALEFFVVTLLLYVYIRWRYRKEFTLAGKIGGPRAYPIIGNALLFKDKDFLAVSELLEKEYGHLKCLRIWMAYYFVLFVNDPNDIEVLLNTKGATEKPTTFYEFVKPVFSNGLILSVDSTWQYNRKAIAPTYNILKLKSYAKIFTQTSEELAIKWEEKIGMKFSPFYDTIGIFFSLPIRTALGDKLFFHLTRDMDLFHFANQVKEVMKILHHRMQSIHLHWDWTFKLSPSYKKSIKTIGIYDKFLEEAIRAKMMDNEEDNSFLSHAIKAQNSYPHFQYEQIFDELKTYVTAGFDTTAVAVNLLFIMLGIHSEIQEKVFNEQMEILGSVDNEPTFDDLNKMTYLEQVMNETLRLFPVVPIFARQMLEEVKIGDKIIPKGCYTAFVPYIIHRREENYPNPLVFNPDRFLPEEKEKRHPYTFLPFGGGPRTCIGQRYAMYSMKAFTSSIIKRYRIHTDYGLDHVLKTMTTSIALEVHNYEISLSAR